MANFLEIFYKSPCGKTEGVLVTDNVTIDPAEAIPVGMYVTEVIIKQGKITPDAQVQAYLKLFPENENDD